MAAKRMAVAVCAMVLSACQSWSDDAPRVGADVQPISVVQARSCRYIADISAASTWPADQDFYWAGRARAKDGAADKAGNAIVVRSLMVATGAQPQTTTSVNVGVYYCNRN